MEIIEQKQSKTIYLGNDFNDDLNRLFSELALNKASVLLITGVKSFNESGLKADFLSLCKKYNLQIEKELAVSPNPDIEKFNQEMAKLPNNISWIFCIGGGSVIDFGKLLKLKKYKKSKIFVLYTLPGSGSIVTPFAIYNNEEFKIGEHSEDIIPDAVYINEAIWDALNPSFKTLALCDIFAHAFESYLSGVNTSESLDYSAWAINILAHYQRELLSISPIDLARADIYAAKAESLALVLFPHAIGHYLTFKFLIPHPIASFLYCKEYGRLLINKGFPIDQFWLNIIDEIEKLLCNQHLIPETRVIDSKEAMTLITKYMGFAIENSPVSISHEEYTNLIKTKLCPMQVM